MPNIEKASVAAASSSKKDSVVTRVDTGYVEKELEKKDRAVTDKKAIEEKEARDKEKQQEPKVKEVEKDNTDKGSNNGDYLNSLTRQNNILEKKNKQIADNK